MYPWRIIKWKTQGVYWLNVIILYRIYTVHKDKATDDTELLIKYSIISSWKHLGARITQYMIKFQNYCIWGHLAIADYLCFLGCIILLRLHFMWGHCVYVMSERKHPGMLHGCLKGSVSFLILTVFWHLVERADITPTVNFLEILLGSFMISIYK